jgi:inorganic pyrophosphatase
MKFEVDKNTGYLTVDRPQRYSNFCPTNYGFIPQTYSGERVAALSREKTGRTELGGDGDPLDICVLTEKSIEHSDIVLSARPIGGLRMIDESDADDKLIAVLTGDLLYGKWRGIQDCPDAILERLKHYFLTYKQSPDENRSPCEITDVYDREEAYEVIRKGRADYDLKFGELHEQFLKRFGAAERSQQKRREPGHGKQEYSYRHRT